MSEATTDSEGESVELSRYWWILRRRWYVVAVCVLLGLAVGVAGVMLSAKTYTATAVVNLNAISSQPFDNTKSDSQLIDAQTEVQLARSATVLGGAADKLGTGTTRAQMLANTDVQPVADATVVRISYTAASAAVATRGADLIASGYLDYRSTSAAEKVAQVADRLKRQRTTLRARLLDLNKKLAHAKEGSAAAIQAESNRQMINAELSSLISQISQFRIVDTQGGTLISSAADNDVVVGPSKKLLLLVPVLAGLVLGLIAAFVVNLLDRRLHGAGSVSSAGGGAVLALLSSEPAIPAFGNDADAIRSLHERLLADVGPGSDLVVVDLTTSSPPSGVGVNLALAMVEDHGACRLVLADPAPEFLEQVAAGLELDSAGEFAEGSVYTSRLVPALGVVTLQREGGCSAGDLAQVLQHGAEHHARTVVALPPTVPRSLRLAAGRLGHAILLVANERGTTTTAIRELTDELDALDALVPGTVLVSGKRSAARRARAQVVRAELDGRPSSAVGTPPLATPGAGHGFTGRRLLGRESSGSAVRVVGEPGAFYDPVASMLSQGDQVQRTRAGA